jgi:hypothetical protein
VLSPVSIGDIVGRRKIIFLAALFTLIRQVLQVSAYNLIQFVVGRNNASQLTFRDISPGEAHYEPCQFPDSIYQYLIKTTFEGYR